MSITYFLTDNSTGKKSSRANIYCNEKALNASIFRNYKESIQNIVSPCQAFYFINSMKGSQAYWQKNSIGGFSYDKAIALTRLLFNIILCRSLLGTNSKNNRRS